MGLSDLIKAADTFLFRPPEQVVIRSATPHDSMHENINKLLTQLTFLDIPKKVSVRTPPKKVLPNFLISMRPRRMTAAFVLLP